MAAPRTPSPPTALRVRAAALRQRHGRRTLQTADQGVAALVNFGVNTAVVRIGGVEGLGQFNLPYTVYLSAVAFQRAVLIEPMLASRDGDRVYAGTVRISAVVSVALGAVIVALGAVLHQPAMIALGLLLPLLLLQDLVRYKHLRDGSPQRALAMDGLWLVATLAPLVLPIHDPVAVVIAWGAGAGAGVALGVLLGARPSFAGTDLADFRRSSRGISGPTAADMLIDQFCWILPIAVAMQLTSLQVSGEYRVATTLMAPLGVVASSWTLSTYAKIRESQDVRRSSVLPGATTILVIGLAYAGLMVAVHGELTRIVFGSPNAVPLTVMLFTALLIPVQSFEGQLAVWFKVNRVASNITMTRAISTIAIVGCIAAATVLDEPELLAAGLTAAGMLQAVISIALYRRLRKAHSSPAPQVGAPARDTL